MNSVLRAGLAALGLVWICVAATAARAQEEAGDDVVTKRDNSKQSGKITAEDVKGVSMLIGKATISLTWRDIKLPIEYAGANDLKTAKASFDAGSIGDAIARLEELRKREGLRLLLKPHVLRLLGVCHYQAGDMVKAIEVLNELFAKYPKTQFFVQGGGETLVNAYLATGKAAEAQKALDDLAKAVSDPAPLAVLKGRVLEATNDFAGAGASYKFVLDGQGDAETKAGAELGIGRCLLGQKKTGEAETKFKSLVAKDVPTLVLAGAWNGLGQIWYEAGAGKTDPELVTDALYAYLRGCVLYVPPSGESTTELEKALRGAHDCFKALSEMEKDKDNKRKLANRAKERLELLRTKFPGSPSLNGIK